MPSNQGWGVSFQNGTYRGFVGQTTTMYSWLPAHPNRPLRLTLNLTQNAADLGLTGSSPVQTKDGITGLNTQLDLQIPSIQESQQTGILQAVQLPTSPWFEFAANGLPFILSPRPEDALIIGGSIQRIQAGPAQGYLAPHKFQESIAELLPQLTANAGNSAALTAARGVNFPATKSECRTPTEDAEVFRSHDVLNTYSGTLLSASWLLGTTSGRSNQDLTGTSPWLGSLVGSVYGQQLCTTSFDCANGSSCVNGLCSQPFNPSTDRWDRFQPMRYRSVLNGRTEDLYAGMSPRGLHHYSLVWAAVTHSPCNPYGPSTKDGAIRFPELLYRGVAGALADLLTVVESEQLNGTNGAATGPYPGNMGFVLKEITPTFMLAAPHLEPVMNGAGGLGTRALQVWTGALERLVNRHLYDYIVSSQNQSSHHLVSFQSFANGVQDPARRAFYQGATRRWATRFFDQIQPAGYFRENTAICSSYSGIQLNMIGDYYRLTEESSLGADTNALSALQSVYTLFNHTAAPEPTGVMVSGFNFNHRIGFGFEETQYGGAKQLVDELPEVGVWSRTASSQMTDNRSTLQSLATSFDTRVNNLATSIWPSLPARFFGFRTVPSAALQFPVESATRFTRNFGNEYIAIRRPGYFTGVFVGKPALGSLYIRYREAYRLPTNANELNTPNSSGPTPSIEDLAPESGASVSVYNYNPYLGGGLSLFWTPAYGNSMIGTTWSALAQHGLVAWSGGLRYWSEYFSTSFSLTNDGNTLAVSGQIEGTPIAYTRTYQFNDQNIDVSISMTAQEAVTLEKFVEVIPLLTCTRANCNGSTLQNRKRNGATITLPSTQEIRALDNQGNGISVTFTGAQTLTSYPHGLRKIFYNDEMQVGRVEVALATSWQAGQTRTLTYRIAPR
jgi:hypothetical protein